MDLYIACQHMLSTVISMFLGYSPIFRYLFFSTLFCSSLDGLQLKRAEFIEESDDQQRQIIEEDMTPATGDKQAKPAKQPGQAGQPR